MKRVALLVVVLGACSGKHPKGKLDESAAKQLFDIVQLDGVPPGESDLTAGENGSLWMLPERDHVVVERSHDANTKHPLEGIAPGLDTEAIAYLGDGHFAIGLEGANLAIAAIAFADVDGDKLVARRTRQLTRDELGVDITINHGIEGLCGSGSELLAATESVGKLSDGTRWAALARLRGDALEVAKLHLTTDKGKISALSCTIGPDGTADVLAIERHYGVSRILSFTAHRGDTDITPTLVVDLAPVLHDSLNLEGIARLPDGRMVTINDNQGRTAEGPTELFYFHPR